MRTTLLKSQNINEYGYIYDRVYLMKNKIPHKVLERLKMKGFIILFMLIESKAELEMTAY